MSGSFPLVWASLAYLGCPCFVWPLPVRFLRFCRYLVLRGSLFRCCFSGCLGGVAFLLLLPLLAWVLAVWPASSLFPLPFPLGCLLVSSGPVCCLLVPPSGYLVVSATVRLPYLWHGVSWVIGSCLHSASWQQRLRPCVGLCPLHHVVGAVHVPLALALRYSPSGDPEYP